MLTKLNPREPTSIKKTRGHSYNVYLDALTRQKLLRLQYWLSAGSIKAVIVDLVNKHPLANKPIPPEADRPQEKQEFKPRVRTFEAPELEKKKWEEAVQRIMEEPEAPLTKEEEEW